jgi:hypothetical protein
MLLWRNPLLQYYIASQFYTTTTNVKNMLDIGYRQNFSSISEGPTEAPTDIAHHGYQTKCSLMLIIEIIPFFLNQNTIYISFRKMM